MRRVIRAERGRAERGTATVELAILLPVYLLLLFGLLYFGFATLAGEHEALAGAYVLLQPGAQTADEILPRFFPWQGPVTTAQPAGDGTEAHVREGALRVGDAPQTEPSYDAQRVTEYLWVLALGEVRQHFVWQNGRIVEVIQQVQDDASRYLNANSITEAGAAHAETAYTRGVTVALNGLGGGQPWLERRESTLEYAYEPSYLRHILPAPQPGAAGGYADVNQHLTTSAPIQTTTLRVATRGAGERLGAADPGSSSSRVEDEMVELLGRGEMLPDPLSAADLSALQRRYWPQRTDSLWVPR